MAGKALWEQQCVLWRPETVPPPFVPGKVDTKIGNSESPGSEHQLDSVERPRARTSVMRNFIKL